MTCVTRPTWTRLPPSNYIRFAMLDKWRNFCISLDHLNHQHVAEAQCYVYLHMIANESCL